MEVAGRYKDGGGREGGWVGGVGGGPRRGGAQGVLTSVAIHRALIEP